MFPSRMPGVSVAVAFTPGAVTDCFCATSDAGATRAASRAAERTKRGGTLVYSVCTLNADENEGVVDASGLEPEPLGEEWPDFAHPARPEFLLTTPHRHGTSGFFIARLRI